MIRFNDLRPQMEVILVLEDGTQVEGRVHEVLSLSVTISKVGGRYVQYWRADISEIHEKKEV